MARFGPRPPSAEVADVEDLEAGAEQGHRLAVGQAPVRGQSPGRARSAPAVNASQASRPPGATAVTAVAKTARSQ